SCSVYLQVMYMSLLCKRLITMASTNLPDQIYVGADDETMFRICSWFRSCRQRRLDLHHSRSGSRNVHEPRDVQHVVDAAHDAEVAVLVAARAVARQVILALELGRKVALSESLRIAPDGADDSRPRALDDENPALALLDVVAGLVHDRRHDSGQRHRAGTRLQRVHAGGRGHP